METILLLTIFICLIVIIILIRNNQNNVNNTSISNNDVSVVRLMDTKHILLEKKEVLSRNINNRFISIENERLLPSSYDIWNNNVNVMDQGPWGSCTAFSFRYAYLLYLNASNINLIEPSTSFIYDLSRINDGNTSLSDTGTSNASVAYIVKNTGFPPLSTFLYTSYNVFHAPPSTIIQSNTNQKYTLSKLSLSSTTSVNISNFKNKLSQNRAIIVGFLVYPSMMRTNVIISGKVPMPSSTERPIGGHSIALTGWDDSIQSFIFRNSWGSYTGNYGMYTIPYNYIANASYAGDVWFFN